MSELLTLPAKSIAQKIKNKEVSPMEVLEAHIQRIEDTNSKLNAVVVKNYEKAKEQAVKAEKRLNRENDLPPMFGVPFTVKDSYAVEGLTWSGGSVLRKNTIAQEDSLFVKTLKDQGMILTAKTNVPEAGLWFETYNKVYGRTNNPHNLEHTPGGSSGGEGALIAAGGIPVGLGSDIGGSIRMPCVFNGICGHKPTGGLAKDFPHWPQSTGPLADVCVSGPMGRYMEDVIEMMKILPMNGEFKDPYGVKIDDLKFYYYDSLKFPTANSKVKSNVRTIVKAMQEEGLQVEYYKPKTLDLAFFLWMATLSELREVDYSVVLGDGSPIDPHKELLKAAIGKSDIILPNILHAILEKHNKSEKVKNFLYNSSKKLQAEMAEKLGPGGVLICPAFPTEAPKHGVPLRKPFGFAYSGIYNCFKFPATCVPTGMTKNGLPLGAQVIAGPNNDHLTLATGLFLEKLFGGWQMAH